LCVSWPPTHNSHAPSKTNLADHRVGLAEGAAFLDKPCCGLLECRLCANGHTFAGWIWVQVGMAACGGRDARPTTQRGCPP